MLAGYIQTFVILIALSQKYVIICNLFIKIYSHSLYIYKEIYL